MNFQKLETPRLYLRILTPEVYTFVFENYSEQELLQFFGCKNLEDLEKEKYKYQNGLTNYRITFLNFQLIEKTNNKIIGACGFHSWFPEHNRAEIGYHLNDEIYKGKGFMSEALERIISYGFNEMNLNRIEALVSTRNMASLNLVRKFDFEKEGVLKSHYFVDGVYEDSVIFGLICENYFSNTNEP